MSSQNNDEFVQLFDQSENEPAEEKKEQEPVVISVDLSSIKPFRIAPSPQRYALELVFREASGLDQSQYRSNSWGFPPIPVPEYRSGNQVYRSAPKNAQADFIGHPIYWIHPKLTKMKDQETDESWSLRMYYLIMGFGYWDTSTSNTKWIDYPLSKGVVPRFEDIQQYHLPGNPPCRFDEAGILTEDDLVIPMAELEGVYNFSIEKISRITLDEMEEYAIHQAQDVELAFNILGLPVNLTDDLLVEESDDSLWNTLIDPEFVEIMSEYNKLFVDGDVTPLIPRLREVCENYKDVLTSVDQIISTLTLPVIRSMELDSEGYAKIIALMNLSLNQDARRAKFYDFTQMENKLFSTEAWKAMSSRSSRALPSVEFYRIMQDKHDDSTSRLKLALINHIRVRNGKEPHENYAMMESSMLRNKIEAQEAEMNIQRG